MLPDFDFVKSVLLLLFKRFFWGWYGVERRLVVIESKIDLIRDGLCGDCPVREWKSSSDGR